VVETNTGAILVGLIIGALARLIMPGKQNIGGMSSVTIELWLKA
jgi:uncharacterized membrane protein YeaQ/YmgE (transglycosylase-associated protein family)